MIAAMNLLLGLLLLGVVAFVWVAIVSERWLDRRDYMPEEWLDRIRRGRRG